MNHLHRRDLTQAIGRSAETVARLVEASIQQAMLGHDRAAASRVVQSLGSEGNLNKVRVLTPDGVVWLSSVPHEVGDAWQRSGPSCRACHVGNTPATTRATVVTAGDQHDRMISVRPIQNAASCQPCHGSGPSVLGTLMVESPIQGLWAELAASVPPVGMVAGVSLLLLGGLLVLLFNATMTRPARQLATAAERIGSGDLEHAVPTCDGSELGFLARELEMMRCRLKASLEAKQRESRQAGALQERDRLARELHDRLAQVLCYVNLKLATVGQYCGNGQSAKAGPQIEEVKQAVHEAHHELREAIFNLRQSATPAPGLVDAVRECVDAARTRYGVDADVVIRGDSIPSFCPDVEAQLLRAIQEALSNAGRHAGARRVRVIFDAVESPDVVEIAVQDDGHGFDPHQLPQSGAQGFGLGIMRERVGSVGGQLMVHSRPGEGTCITIRVPKQPRGQVPAMPPQSPLSRIAGPQKGV